MKTEIIRVEEELSFNPLTPFNLFLLGVLERALRDLDESDISLQKSAVKWFNAKPHNLLPRGVSFKDVTDHVELQASYAIEIKAKVKRTISSWPERKVGFLRVAS